MSDDELRPSRTLRSARVEKRWKIQAAVVVALVVVLIAIAMLAGNNGSTPSASPAPPPTVAATGAIPPSDLLAFSITGAPSALAATIGGGQTRSSAAGVVPPNLTFVMPGAGEMNSDRIQDLAGDQMRLGVSNIGGTWDGHYAAMDIERFGGVIDRLGGLTVDLSDVYPAGAEALGPGSTRLSGAQVVSLLRTRADDTASRFADVLRALLAAQPAMSPTDFSSTDDPQTAAAMLAPGATRVEIMPSEVVGGSILSVAQPDLDDLMTELFGTSTPARAEVRNGNGSPGVGGEVAAQLIPAGFRIVLSENADTFDYKTTEVVANGTENEAAATAALDAIGVGKITVSQISSGLADVSVTVGQDYHG
jgi:LytR cell envelope-related transcriptional attenuator/LytR_cpsA_psr family